MQRNYEEVAIYDLLGVGIGPFNLGLAALAEPLNELNCLFCEQSSEFNWHPGLLMADATLQVPFLADLVSLANPASEYSFLNYLKEHNRLYKFYFYEKFFILRQEYNHYCQWVATKLNSIRFSSKVLQIHLVKQQDQELYEVVIQDCNTLQSTTVYARHIAIGVGTKPYIPVKLATALNEKVFHSANFMNYQQKLTNARSICVIGSGQSAAEIVLELLKEKKGECQLNWITRAPGFFPMEYSKLGLEHFSPDYMDYFYNLKPEVKHQVIQKQDMMYKGISKQTIADIFDVLYQSTIANQQQPLNLLANTSLDSIQLAADNCQLQLHNKLSNVKFELESDAVILATGYRATEMNMLATLDNLFTKNDQQYALNADFSLQSEQILQNKIFMQNNSLHSHGVGSPDLGLGCYRNSVILNTICGKPVYQLSNSNVFQKFAISEAGVNNGIS